jgi:hypothetical protein
MSVEEAAPPQPVVNQRQEVLIRELNPYRPSLPEEIEDIDPVLYDFMREQVEIQREQHNTTQAGDSTFPWELLTKVGPERQFTLGSLGRFYHDDHGLILARYVQFGRFRTPGWLNGPVGRPKSSQKVDWVVTNDLDQSDSDSVIGILGSYKVPPAGWYGWVLTQGANHAPILLETGIELEVNDELVWTGFETVAKGQGRILMRARGPVNRVHALQHQLDIGCAYIDIEGPSFESLRARLGSEFEGILADLQTVQESLNEYDLPGLTSGLTKVMEGLELLSQRVEGIGTNDIPDILTRLKTLEKDGGFDGLLQTTREDNETLNRALRQLITRAQERAESAERTAQKAAGLAGLMDQLAYAVAQLQTTPKTSLIPMVDGGIPPQLIYTSDGNLVFVETPL